MIELLALQAICNSKRPEIAAIYPFLTAAMLEYDADTPLRMAMFLAQGAHETMGFRYLEEIASGQAYENRKDLGNTQPGDGVKFKGRGVFMVTGRSNYARCSAACFGSDTLMLEHPEQLSEPFAAAKSAGWYWAWKGLNKAADAGDVQAATRVINGGTNGLDQRIALYKRACYALGLKATC